MRGSLIVISAPDPSLFSGGALVEGKESNQLHADAIKNFAMLAVGYCGVFDSMQGDNTQIYLSGHIDLLFREGWRYQIG